MSAPSNDIMACPKCGHDKVVKGSPGRIVCKRCGGTGTYARALAAYEQKGGPKKDKTKAEYYVADIAEKDQTIRELREEVKILRSEASIVNRLRALIHDLGDRQKEVPGWVRQIPPTKVRGTPTLFLSDLHWGEVVFSKQVNGVNHYDLPTARNRLRHTTEAFLSLCYDELSRPDYPGVVMPLGGDCISGNIHEELRETNDAAVLECVADVEDHIARSIMTVAKEAKNVFVPCVVGNHGRMDRKPRAKNGVVDNLEWLVYEMLRKRFASSENITVIVPNSFDCLYTVHGHRYLMTHGDQFKGGSGITGPLLPWKRGQQKKAAVYSAVDQDFDFLIMGHWHQAALLPGGIIVNGSLKGYDEYAFRMGFEFQLPQQVMWITDPKHGIWYWQPINCDSVSAPPSRSWVEVAA